MATSVFSEYTDLYHSVGGRAKRDGATTSFRQEMAKVIPWQRLDAQLRPHCFAGRRGRKPMPLGLMIRLHMLQRLHDSQALPNLLHGGEGAVFGDKAYAGQAEAIRKVAPKALDFTLRKGHRHRPLSAAEEETNRLKSSIRAMVEHPFRVLKCRFGYRKVRYRGLQKNASHQCTLVALINPCQFRADLMAVPC